MEPYDDSMPEILKKNGIYSHLISDHYHYWEDGGCTYHNRYSSWENVRGQEGDHWKACVGEKELPPHLGECVKQDMVNREYADTVEKWHRPKPSRPESNSWTETMKAITGSFRWRPLTSRALLCTG